MAATLIPVQRRAESNELEATGRVFVITPSGAVQRRLRPGYAAAWDPSSRRLAVISDQLYVVDRDGRNTRSATISAWWTSPTTLV
jgi:hypothetical protein